MSSLKQIDILDEALRINFLERGADAFSAPFMEDLLTEGKQTMPSDKKQLLITRLQQVMETLSFGQLVSSSMVKNRSNAETLSEQTGLPLNVIEELCTDAIYANSVPVVFLKNLLVTLQISVDAARKGIKRTFDMLQQQSVLQSGVGGSVAPAFRKGYYTSRQASRKNPASSEGKELFENQEALNRYLDCLEELMK